jgi:hypothetical protein
VNGEFYRSNYFLPLSVDRKTSTDCYNNITGTLPGQYVKYKVAATPSCFSLQFYPDRDAELTWPAAHNALSITSHPQPPKHKHPPKKPASPSLSQLYPNPHPQPNAPSSPSPDHMFAQAQPTWDETSARTTATPIRRPGHQKNSTHPTTP